MKARPQPAVNGSGEDTVSRDGKEGAVAEGGSNLSSLHHERKTDQSTTHHWEGAEMNIIGPLLLIAFSFFLVGCPRFLYNVTNANVPQVDGSKQSLADVKAAIMRSTGDPRVRYIMEDVEPGLIRCQLQYKIQHKAWMDIPYSTDSYSIIYIKSENLRYQPYSEDRNRNTISGHYNNWIRALDNSIQEELAKGPSASTKQDHTEHRLLNLQKLRDSNLLSEEEYQTQRARILKAL